MAETRHSPDANSPMFAKAMAWMDPKGLRSQGWSSMVTVEDMLSSVSCSFLTWQPGQSEKEKWRRLTNVGGIGREEVDDGGEDHLAEGQLIKETEEVCELLQRGRTRREGAEEERNHGNESTTGDQEEGLGHRERPQDYSLHRIHLQDH